MNKYLNPKSYIRVVCFYRRYLVRNAFVVAGLGRCGTTMMYNSFFRSGIRCNDQEYAMELDRVERFQGGTAYKTHDYPPAGLPSHVRLIYMFGNPMNIAISAHRNINMWGKTHHRHLRSLDKFRENDDVLVEDTLSLERQFDAWYRPQGFDFISVRYEALYEERTQQQLSEFLGLRLNMVPYRHREADFDSHPRKADLLAAYGSLLDKVLAADDVKIWKAVARQACGDAAADKLLTQGAAS